jgi:hypothetical protein
VDIGVRTNSFRPSGDFDERSRPGDAPHAEMIGTTRSRVNFFMNKFKNLGFTECNDGLNVNHSLLTVIVHE